MSLLHPTNYGIGVIASTVGAAPAAGANPTVTVPVGRQWRLQGVECRLITSATVATRVPVLEFLTAGPALFARNPQLVGLAAGGNYQYTWARGVGSGATSAAIPVAELPDVLLPGGYVIRMFTSGIQVGDQWAGLQLVYEEWTSSQ